MSTTWRIVKKRHSTSAFDGEGARRFGGRWNSPGTSVVYTSESRALALLEVLAGIRSVHPFPSYVLIPVSFDNALVHNLQQEDLAADWRQSPPSVATQAIGDGWVSKGKTVILSVPSVVIPDEYNFLLNPTHPDFHQVRIGEPEDITLDPRLLP